MGAQHRSDPAFGPVVPAAPARASRRLGRVSYRLLLAALAGAYVGTAKLGIGLSVAHGVVTPVWAPTGIAIAALFLFGRRLWPAVALGAYVANATSGAGLLLAAGIAVGNTLEAVVAVSLLSRAGFRSSLDRVRDVLAFVVLAACASTTVSATNGVAVLAAGGKIQWGDFGSEWLLWWFGDTVGALLVAPLLLVSFAHRRQRPRPRTVLEAAVLFGALGGLSTLVFLLGAWRYPYLLFPLLIAATLRFHQLAAVASAFLVGALATAGAVADTIPVNGDDATGRVQIFQALTGIVAVSLLILAATLAERGAALGALKHAQELTHIGTWEWDPRSGTVTWSDELYRIYGLQPQSLRLTYGLFLDRVHPADRALVEAAVREAYLDGGSCELDHRIVLPDGRERMLHARGRVVEDDAGARARMVGTAQDITDRRQIEKLRETILAAVSHELRTPLTSVLGFAQTLKQRRTELPDAVVEQLVEHVAGQAERLDDLLGGLLDLDRLRRGLVTPTRKPTDLARLAQRVAAGYEGTARPLVVDAEPVQASVDPQMVERIVDNLLANAAKHTPDGTSISLVVRRAAGDALIAVEDDGPGVPDNLKSGIFELFERGASDDSTTPGTGIGLSLVAQFAELHGGRAWVEDRPGGGASFRVLLPTDGRLERRAAAAAAAS